MFDFWNSARQRALEADLARQVEALKLVAGDNVRLQVERDAAKKDADYWRTRAEKLIDAALARTQQIGAPVMEEHKPSEFDKGIRSVVGSIGRRTFSTKAPTA